MVRKEDQVWGIGGAVDYLEAAGRDLDIASAFTFKGHSLQPEIERAADDCYVLRAKVRDLLLRLREAESAPAETSPAPPANSQGEHSP